MFSRVIHVLHLLVFLNETSLQIFLPLIIELCKKKKKKKGYTCFWQFKGARLGKKIHKKKKKKKKKKKNLNSYLEE